MGIACNEYHTCTQMISFAFNPHENAICAKCRRWKTQYPLAKLRIHPEPAGQIPHCNLPRHCHLAENCSFQGWNIWSLPAFYADHVYEWRSWSNPNPQLSFFWQGIIFQTPCGAILALKNLHVVSEVHWPVPGLHAFPRDGAEGWFGGEVSGCG